MALDIPLPAPPPGGFYGGMTAANKLARQFMENQYYGPNIESEMGYRNALAKGQNIKNQYLPQKLQLANAFQQLQNQFYAPNIQSEIASRNALANRQNIESQFLPENIRSQISNRNALTQQYETMTPLKAQELEQKNKFYPELTQADIAQKNATANFRNMGGGRMGVDQQAIQGLKNQIMQDNPGMDFQIANQIAGAALSGENVLPSGEQIPKLSGTVQSMLANINKKHSTAAIQNQAANMDILSKDMNDIDITPIS